MKCVCALRKISAAAQNLIADTRALRESIKPPVKLCNKRQGLSAQFVTRLNAAFKEEQQNHYVTINREVISASASSCSKKFLCNSDRLIFFL